MPRHFLLIFLLPLAALALSAAEPQSSPAVEPGFDFKTGTVEVGIGLATIQVPEGFRWLESKDARRLLQKCGNPDNPEVLGLLLGPETTGRDPYFVVASYVDSGHVDDNDAASIDFDDLLKDMKESMPKTNAARRAAHLPTVDLIGWAEPPHYDAQAKNLYWAKLLRFEGNPQETLNYCIRLLGRTGVLELNVVADQQDLSAVRTATPTILAATTFKPGKRYQDFTEGDRKSEWGVAGLIAGGLGATVLAKKAGLLAILLKIFFKGGFLIFIPLIAIFRRFKRPGRSLRDGDLPSRRRQDPPPTA